MARTGAYYVVVFILPNGEPHFVPCANRTGAEEAIDAFAHLVPPIRHKLFELKYFKGWLHIEEKLGRSRPQPATSASPPPSQ